MENMLDYVQKYQVSFKEKPLNTIDSMIFAQLAYSHFTRVKIPAKFSDVPLDDDLLEKLTVGTLADDNLKKLWLALIKSPRYCNVKWTAAVDKIDAQSETQFGAVTFEFMPGYYYIAYRGTTATTIGWKENFNMSFEDIVPSQFFARKYFRRRLNYFPGKYYLGGHSKGGNLAFFVSLTANKREKASIFRADCFDGPGFHYQKRRYDQKILSSLNVMHKYLPQGSLVGILMDDLIGDKEYCHIIKSKGIGPFQHDMFNWKIQDDHFVLVDDLISPSQISQKAVQQILTTTNDQEREEFITTLYDAINVYDDIYLKKYA